MPNRGSLSIPQPSGLWRRFAAMFIDILVLAVIGLLAGRMLLGVSCASLGALAQLIGLAVAILYTALLNSRTGGGRTVGKWLCDIQVVGENGLPVSFARSLGRSVLLWIGIAQPPVSRDIALQSGSAAVVIAALLLTGALGLGILYLLLFNRETRQGLHDLIAGTFVVKKGGAPHVIDVPLRRVHWYVLAGLFMLVAAGITLQVPSQRRQVDDFQRLEHELRQIEGFHQLRHFQESGRTLEVGVQLKRPPESFETAQHRVAGIVLNAYLADRIERMKVTVACSCDLGILGRIVKWGVDFETSRNATVADWRREAPR